MIHFLASLDRLRPKTSEKKFMNLVVHNEKTLSSCAFGTQGAGDCYYKHGVPIARLVPVQQRDDEISGSH